jgi:uncharacterized protein YyaL (SSP411 family)
MSGPLGLGVMVMAGGFMTELYPIGIAKRNEGVGPWVCSHRTAMRSLPLVFASFCLSACVAEQGPLANQMARSGTHYLAGAAHEPVSWQAWGQDAFKLAARLDRPILLYIGADDCSRCLLMDRETYSDPALGALVDSLFVPVRVDRDERPDVAARYGTAVQLLTGLRGYPLTAFLMPDGSTFFGGTYFPLDDPLTGRGMRQILPEVARSFRHQRAFLLRQATLVRQLAFTREVGAHGVLEPRVITAEIDSVCQTLVEALRSRTDLGNFAYTQAVALLLASSVREGDTSDLRVARSVLDYVADSGLAAVAADERDSPPGLVRAGMLRNLGIGWAVTGEPRYRDAARRLLASLRESLGDAEGRMVFADREAYVIASVLESAVAIGDSAGTESGLARLSALLKQTYAHGRGVRHTPGWPSSAPLLLQDQVQMAGACLAAYNATGERRYLDVAVDLAAVLDRSFADSMGGYFDHSNADHASASLRRAA